MDSENSGAIFRLKNIALVRSSPVVPQTKVIDSKLSSVKKKPVVSDQSAAINSIFDQIYRATPLPSATILQNSNYNTSFWDNGLQFASDMPNISPIYGISQSLSSSHSGGISYPSYEKSQQLHLHDMQSRQQNQYHSANFSAPTMIPPSNRLSRISDSSTSQIAQHQAGSQFQWQVELKDSPAENTSPDPKSAKDSRNNPQDNFSLEQDSAIDIYADESAVDIRDVDEDNCTASTGKLLIKISEEDATLTNTAVSNSSRSSSAISKISSSSSSGSKSRADPSSSSSVFVDTLGDVSTRPKLRRKFVMDSLFSLNIKPSAEQQLLSGNESTGEKTAKDKIVKRMSVSETKNLSVGGSKGVSSKKLTITHEADNIDRIGCTRDSSEEDNIAHVKPMRGGVGLSYTANFPDSKNSTASKGTGSWVSQSRSLSQSKSIPPSQSPKKQQKKPLIHGSLILVPLARLYTSSTASSSDDDISESYRRMKRKARSAVKAKTDKKKASVRKDKVIDLDSETETGIGTETDSMPLETVRTKSEVRHSESASGPSLSHEAPKIYSEELPQVKLLQQKALQTTVLYDSLSQEPVRPAAVRKVRESTRLKGSSSASEEEPSMGHQEPPSSPTLTRATRSSLSSHEGRKSTESDSSSVGVRACVRSEGVISSAAHMIRTRRKPVETPCDETVIVSTDEWHKDEVRMQLSICHSCTL